MNITKHITSRIASRNKTMFGAISNCIKNNMRTSALVLGLMGLPMFSSMADNPLITNGSGVTPTGENNLQDVDVSISKDGGSPFKTVVDHKVIGIDLGMKNVCLTNSSTDKSSTVIKLQENSINQKYFNSLIIAPEPSKLFLARKNGLNGSHKVKSDTLANELIKEHQKNPNKSKLTVVPGYKYLTQCVVGQNTSVIPIQDMMTEIDINNPSEYGKKQIFGIMLQAKQLFYNELTDIGNKNENVDLNLTLSDNIPEENKEIISAIYAEAYAEKFCGGDLSKINVSWITESDAALATYLYENSNTLQNIENHGKLVVLDLGQSGLRMKGLNGTDKEIQLTKSKTYENISGDLIDQAIWEVFKNGIMNSSGIDLKTLETDLKVRGKCLAELNKVKEKLSAQGADAINVNIEIGDNDADFTFSVQEINEALNKAGLIETFKDDIKEGVKQMYGKDQDIKDIQFAIVGGSLRIPCLKKAVAELHAGEEITGNTATIEVKISKNLIQTINMDEFASHGASYASLLKENYKNKLLKKVDVKQKLSIKDNDKKDNDKKDKKDNSIKFEASTNEKLKEIKSELDELVNLNKNQQEASKLRNEIEAICYDINNKIDKVKVDGQEYLKSLSNDIVTHIRKLNKVVNNLEYLETLKSMLKVGNEDVSKIASCLENVSSFIAISNTNNPSMKAKYYSGFISHPFIQQKIKNIIKKLPKDVK